ncbi:purine-cytosine permease FCY21 [Coniella lustricola]|uniref:Purine-cytosine permease FCY21 n=1 Tax=Coniella lustricola TaxID=2025994 RepID=A0A2T3AFN4_9PEZI|nr:purine-cytosine permease FCY21 [Coniella lustricola]
MTVSGFAIGVLAQPVFNLDFVATALTIVFINLVGTLPVCFFSTFGPRFGLRQMIVSRFFFGYYGVKLTCICWSSVNVVVGAQLLAAIKPEAQLPGWAGILIISLGTLLITVFGYRLVHAYERWSWMPVFVIFLITAGVFGRSGDFNAVLSSPSGSSGAGSILSFSASVFGFATGWTSMAADYTVYQPEKTSKHRVFWWTFGGLFLPLVFTQLLGAAIMTAAVPTTAMGGLGHENTNVYIVAYSSSGIGGILAVVLVTHLGPLGQFCLAMLALSIIANNCPNIYSVALSIQVLAKSTQRVPRFVWTFLATCACVAISVPGYSRFERWLENFMLLTGYWLAIYEGVALTEHFFFRVWRGYGYDVHDHDDPDRLPPGMAAVSAFVVGVVGAVLGMAQSWWTGPVGRQAGGEAGGDVGFEMAFGMIPSLVPLFIV